MASSAIILTAKPTLLNVIRSECKSLNIEDVVCPVNADEVVVALSKYPDALLIVDFGVGPGEVHKTLSAAQKETKVEVRPIFLFAVEDTPGIQGMATEFSVLLLHVGEVTRDVIKNCISELLRAEPMSKELRQQLARAAQARNSGDTSAAETVLRQAAETYPEENRVAVELAELMLSLGRDDQALAVLQPLVAKPDSNPRLLNMFGRAMLRLGRATEATVYLQRAKLINPFNFERLMALGEAYLETGNGKRAVQNFDAALKLDPKNSDAQMGKGKGMLVAGDINDALKFLKEVSGPAEMASVFNTAAVICMRNGRTGEGFNLYKVAVSAVGSEKLLLAKLSFNLGIGYRRVGNAAKARDCFAMAVALAGNYDKARWNLAQMEGKVGKSAPIQLSEDLAKDVLSVSRVEADAVPPRPESAGNQSSGLEDEDYDLVF